MEVVSEIVMHKSNGNQYFSVNANFQESIRGICHKHLRSFIRIVQSHFSKGSGSKVQILILQIQINE
jgi:hypothetical protein